MLTGKQKQQLKALGHSLDAIVQIGRAGVNEAVTASAVDALHARELIKVRVLKNCPVDPENAATALAQAAEAELVQVVGRMGLLYKRNPDKPKIELL